MVGIILSQIESTSEAYDWTHIIIIPCRFDIPVLNPEQASALRWREIIPKLDLYMRRNTKLLGREHNVSDVILIVHGLSSTNDPPFDDKGLLISEKLDLQKVAS